MHRSSWRFTSLAIAGSALLALGACQPRDNAETESGAIDRTAVDTGVAPTTAESGAGAERLSDANIVALLDEANMADSAAGALAMKKATNPEVKNFAKLMMGEHHALRLQGQELAKRLNVTPQPPPNDPVKSLASQEMAALESTPKGPEFDRIYIQNEVAAHRAVLDLAKKAHDQAQNDDLKKLIEQAQPVIEKHLELAEDIQKKLGGPSA